MIKGIQENYRNGMLKYAIENMCQDNIIYVEGASLYQSCGDILHRPG
jgi:hypothetical protein